MNINYRAQITNSSSSNCNLKLTLMSKIPPGFNNSTTTTYLATYLSTYLSIYNISKHSSCLQAYSVDTRALTEVAVSGGGGCRLYKNGLGFLNKAKLGNRGSVCHINVSPALSLLCLYGDMGAERNSKPFEKFAVVKSENVRHVLRVRLLYFPPQCVKLEAMNVPEATGRPGDNVKVVTVCSTLPA